MQPQLRVADFPKGHGSPGKVAFVVDGRNVYFAGLTMAGEVMSTINAAETIMLGIAQLLKTNWARLIFFDIQTHRGYKKRKGWYEVDRLKVTNSGERPHVTAWHPVAQAAWPKILAEFQSLDNMSMTEADAIKLGKDEQAKLPGIPDHVLALFQEIIES